MHEGRRVSMAETDGEKEESRGARRRTEPRKGDPGGMDVVRLGMRPFSAEGRECGGIRQSGSGRCRTEYESRTQSQHAFPDVLDVAPGTLAVLVLLSPLSEVRPAWRDPSGASFDLRQLLDDAPDQTRGVARQSRGVLRDVRMYVGTIPPVLFVCDVVDVPGCPLLRGGRDPVREREEKRAGSEDEDACCVTGCAGCCLLLAADMGARLWFVKKREVCAWCLVGGRLSAVWSVSLVRLCECKQRGGDTDEVD